MNQSNRHFLMPLARSAFAGWMMLASAWGFYIFLLPHNPESFTPVGTFGAFIVWGLVYSFFYLLNFLLLAVPYFLLIKKRPQPNPLLQTLCGAVLFGISVPLWHLASKSSDLGEVASLIPFAAIVGGLTFSTLKPSDKSQANITTSPHTHDHHCQLPEPR
jgi:hypothetical protein